MVLAFVGLLVVGAGIFHWFITRTKVTWTDPRQEHLATLLLVSTRAFDEQNRELYQAAIKEIVYIMSEERWPRAEIEWRIRQALLIAKPDTTPEHFEKAICVAQNIARVTVHSANLLPWERPFGGTLALPSSNSTS
jgi:hypothetical protein